MLALLVHLRKHVHQDNLIGLSKPHCIFRSDLFECFPHTLILLDSISDLVFQNL
jgi:hypothetical protein